MNMVRFLTDVEDLDTEEVVWKKGNIYKILYEDDDYIQLEHDSCERQSRAVSKRDLNYTYIIYSCDFNTNINCNHCKYLSIKDGKRCCNYERESDVNAGQLFKGPVFDVDEEI